MPADEASMRRDVGEMNAAGFIPVGISYDNRQMYLFYVKDADRRSSRWEVFPYASEDAARHDLAARLETGWFPAGFTVGAGRFWVLYLKGSFPATRARYVSCPIENESIRRTVEEGRREGLFPVGIDSIGDRLLMLLVHCEGPAPTNWSMGSFRLDASDATELVNAQLRDGYTPFDILVAGQRVNVFYLKLATPTLSSDVSPPLTISPPEGQEPDRAPVLPAAPRLTAPPMPPASVRTPREGTLTTSDRQRVTLRQISSGRGIVHEATVPDQPLAGFRLSVPAGAYDRLPTFAVTAATISSSTFEGVRPASPLVKIENGGGYSRDLMTVRIPAVVADDEFAMGFYYDAASRRLEAIPLVAADSQSVTVATRHFSSLFVGAIKLALLDRAVTTGKLDSGFRPGIDDWPFPNYGSYIEPLGHCAGQSLTALWYYVTRPDGPGTTLHLRGDRNGLRPSTPDLWEDDNLGYRFASIAQNAIDWENAANRLMFASEGVSDALTFRAFAYALHATGEPQQVVILSDSGGHDMIVYRVEANTLFIADPNYPGNNERRIVYDAARGRFRPYNSAANAREIAAGGGTSYDTILFGAKTATIEWNVLAARWREVQDRSIGRGVFPAYQFLWREGDGPWGALAESQVLNRSRIRVSARVGRSGGAMTLYRNGELIRPGTLVLDAGRNDLDGTVWGVRGKDLAYVDFTPITIFFNAVTLDPPRLEGEVDRDYEIEAKVENGPQSGVIFEWTVDGNRQAASGPAPTFRFPQAGRHLVGVVARGPRGEWLGTCSAVAVIAGATPSPPVAATGNLARLHATTRLHQLGISGGEHLATYGATSNMPAETRWEAGNFTAMHMLIDEAELPITWNGTRFTGSRRWTLPEVGDRFEAEVSGTVSPDGDRLVSASWTWRRYRLSTGLMTMDLAVDVTNFPGPGFRGHTSMASEITPQQAAASFRVIRCYTQNTARSWSYTAHDWARGSKPRLNIDFR